MKDDAKCFACKGPCERTPCDDGLGWWEIPADGGPTKWFELRSTHDELMAACAKTWRLNMDDNIAQMKRTHKALMAAQAKQADDHFASVLAEWTDAAKEWDADPKIVFGLINKLRGQVDAQMAVVEAARNVISSIEFDDDVPNIISRKSTNHSLVRLAAILDALDKKESETGASVFEAGCICRYAPVNPDCPVHGSRRLKE